MSQPRLQTVVQHLRKLVDAEERIADAELLARFVARRDEAAFTMLVQRHGPMVLGVCRRMLKRTADTEDAWQATFLVLARKATAIRKQASIAAWLHGVALRICQRSREKNQRHKHDELTSDLLGIENDDLSWREVQRILDEELQRLPERLRQPVVLCYLEGKTRDEAAEELGWTLSTFRGRLDMARERLRKRLIKRGLTLPAALLATLLSQAGEAGAVPQVLLESVLPAAVSGSAPIALAPLVEGGIQAMAASKVPVVMSVILAAGLMIGGSAHFSQKGGRPGLPIGLAAAESPVEAPSKEEPKKDPVKKPDLTDEMLQRVLQSDRIVVWKPNEAYRSIRGANGKFDVVDDKDLDNRPFTKDHDTRFIFFTRSIEEGSASPKLFAINPTNWYVEHTPELEKNIRAAIPLPKSWGETKNGLRMGLLPRHASFKKGEDIVIDIAVENTSDKDVSFKQLRYNIYDYWLLTFLVETPTGKALTLSKPPTQFNESDTPLTRVLKPGETYFHTVRLNRWLSDKEKDTFAGAGNYSVAVSNNVIQKWEPDPKDYLASSKIEFEVLPMDHEVTRLKDVTAHLDRLQVSFQLAPVDPKGVANPPYPHRYVMLNVLPIPIEPHGKWPNGTPIGADARITKEQAGKIVTALAKLGFLDNASGAIPEFHRNGPYASITLRYRPDGAMENKQLWLPLDWNLQLVRYLQAIRSGVDGDAAKHLDAMLTSLEADRKKWEAEGLSLDKMQGRWRMLESEWKGRGWPLPEGMKGTISVNAEQIGIDLVAGESNKGGILDADYRFDGKIVLEAPPDQPLWLNDRNDLAEGRWIILRGTWSTNGSLGTLKDEPVWYHPTKHLLRISIPGQQSAFLVFLRDDVNWGEEGQGLAIRTRPTKTRWSVGEQPTFEIDLRNRGTKSWSVTAVPPQVEVEMNGEWHSFSGELDFKAAIRNLKAGEQIDKWMTVAPDKTWGAGGDGESPRIPLEWKPGKHKVRLAYSIQGKVHLQSNVVEIEIVADPQEASWGPAVQGLQLRLRSTQQRWQVGEQPVFELDLRNRGTQTWQTRPVRYLAQVEVGGKWYNYADSIDIHVTERKLEPNQQIDTWLTVKPDRNWVHGGETDEKALPLEWKPGKQSVRVGYQVGNNAYVHSNIIEIEVVDPKEVGWGDAVEGLQLRGRPTKAAWNIGEQPTFEVDLRNRGNKEWEIRAVSLTTTVEIDGVWHRLGGIANVPAPIEQLKPGEQKNPWFTVAPDKSWIRNLTPETSAPLEWKPGKHKIRLGYTIKDKVQPITAAFDIEIVDAATGAWGDQADGLQLRLWTAKPNWRSDELPLLHVDLFNGRKDDLNIDPDIREFSVELDGTLYHFGGEVEWRSPVRVVKPGERVERWRTFAPGRKWIKAGKSSEPAPLAWTPGKHIVRVEYILGKLKMWSDFIDINIVDAKKVDWGKPKQGLQVRARATKPVWNVGEKPAFEIDLRNVGTLTWKVTAIPPHTLVELDGDWYSYKLPLSYPAVEQELKGEAAFVKWYTVAPNKDWTQDDFVDKPKALEWKPGKHKLRFGYPIKGKELVPISEVVEIEIVDPKGPVWGEPDKGIRLGLSVTKKVWSTDETPLLQVVLGNQRTTEVIARNQTTFLVEVDGLTYAGPENENSIAAFTKIAPNATIDNLPGIRLDAKWIWQTVDAIYKPLKLAPGKHTIRVTCNFEQTKPFSNAIEIEIVDPKTLGWGEADNGVRTRLTVAKKIWRTDEVPILQIDLRNERMGAITVSNQPTCVLELDGLGYRDPNAEKTIAGFTSFGVGTRENFIRIPVDDRWITSAKVNKPDRLGVGKHTIRVTCDIDKYKPVSNAIEIEMVDPKEIGWGKAVNDFQLRARSAKPIYNTEQIPSFMLDVRNKNKTGSDTRLEQYAQIEVDGTWYFASLPDLKDFPWPKHKWEQEQVDDWLRINLGSGVWRRSEQDWIGPAPLVLSPGKHTLRIAYPLKCKAIDDYEANLQIERAAKSSQQAIDAAKALLLRGIISCQKDGLAPISDPVEFEIVDPKEIAWGKPHGEFQVRLRTTKTTYRTDEFPTFELDLRSQGKNEVTTTWFSACSEIEVDGAWYYIPLPDIGLPERKITAGERIDKWAEIQIKPDVWHLKTPMDPLPQKLNLNPGKHTIRAAYPVANNIRPVSEPIEIEIVDPKEVGWGEPVNGIQARARKQAFKYADQDTFKLELDLRNQSKQDIKANRLSENTELEVDGVWYESPTVWSFYFPKGPIEATLRAGQQFDSWSTIVLHKHWYKKTPLGQVRPDKPEQLEMKPGKHIVRLAYRLKQDLRPISEPIEIEIVDPKEVGWGQPVDGLQLRGRSTQAAWKLGEQPVFVLDLRSRGTTLTERRSNSYITEIEVDGMWYDTLDPAFYLEFGKYDLKANAQIDDWLTVIINNAWRHVSNNKQTQLEWTPGKHRICLAYELKDKCKPITDAFEITILDPKGNWGEVSGGVQLRGRPSKPTYKLGEVPAFELDLRNRGTTTIEREATHVSAFIEVDGKMCTVFDPGFYGGQPITRTNLKPNDQIDKWMTIQFGGPAWEWFDPSDKKSKPLEWKAGKYKVRVGYPLAEKVKPMTEFIEFEIVDAKQSGEWSEAVGNMQIRVRPANANRRADIPPAFYIDVRNVGNTEVAMGRFPLLSEVEVDGRWYHAPFGLISFPSEKVKAGQQTDRFVEIRLDEGTWRSKADTARRAPLTLMAGKHTLRVAYRMQRVQGMPTSQPIELEVADDKEAGWGEAVEGIQLRGRSTQTIWNAGDSPRFEIDIRNKSDKTWRAMGVPAKTHIEIDKRWYACAFEVKQQFPTRELKPGDLYGKWISITPDFSFKSPNFVEDPSRKIDWTVGKHKIRLAYEIKDGVKPITAEFEIEIVEVKK
jgi:RNA polymerase sigma factor (sigma-70 family)